MTMTKKTPPDLNPEQWLDAYGDWLYQFALARVKDAHAAEDLVQETLIAGFKGFDRFEHRSNVKTWLTSILRRRVADYFKKLGRRPTVTGGTDENDHFAFAIEHAALFSPKISNEEFQTSMERDEFMQAVQGCVDKLPLHLRQAFVTRTNEDEKSLEEISNQMGVTKNNLGVRLFRSRLMLRACLEKFWNKS